MNSQQSAAQTSSVKFGQLVLESNYPVPPQQHPPGEVQQTQNGFRLQLPASQLASFEFFIRQADDSWQPVPSLTALVATGKDGGYHDSLHWTLRRSGARETTNQLWFWTVSANANGGRPLPQLTDHGTNFTHTLAPGDALDWWQLATPAQTVLKPGEEKIIPLFRTHGTATARGTLPKEAFLRVRCEPLPAEVLVSPGQHLVEAGLTAHGLLKKTLPPTTNGLTTRFSAVREFVLSVSDSRADFLDLDLGKVVAGTVGNADDLRSATDPSPLLKRVRTEGVDFGWATNYEGVVMPVCLDMGFYALPRDWSPTVRITMGAFANVTNIWNDLRAESLKELLEVAPKASHPGLHIPTNYVGCPCIFQTRSGTLGLLQITEITDNPRAVKIRYKLVQGGVAKTAAAPKSDCAPAGFTNEYSHTVKIGPSSYSPITKAPSPNPVQIGPAPRGKYDAENGYIRIALTNHWNNRLLVWWVRTQVRSRDPVTDEHEWITVAEDYPRGCKSAHVLPGASDEFLATAPASDKPWRVSILYDREVANPPVQTGPSKIFHAYGTFEVSTAEMKE